MKGFFYFTTSIGTVLHTVIVSAVIVYLTYSCSNSAQKTLEIKNKKVSDKIIQPPLPQIDIEYASYKIEPSNGIVLHYKTGSEIRIPKDAFLDKKGNVISDTVEVKYREYHTALDAYIAGIPMDYDTADNRMAFETAGMLEIHAYSKGKAVYENPQSQIEIDFNSYTPATDYNVYSLDTVSRKWAFIQKSKIKRVRKAKELQSLPLVPPEPKVAAYHAFTIGDDTEMYPELKMYKNVMFQPVNEEACGLGSATEIQVTDNGDGTYTVRFIADIPEYNFHEEESCKCYLAFKKGEDYSAAMQAYQKKYAPLIEKQTRQRDRLYQKWQDYYTVMAAYRKAGMLDYFMFQNAPKEERVIRTLIVNRFGFINCDKPTAYPSGAELTVHYTDKNGNALDLKNVILIEKGRNALFRYNNEIKFDPEKENILWGITPDNKLAYFKEYDFKGIDQTEGNYTLAMNITEEALKSYEEIQRILFMGK